MLWKWCQTITDKEVYIIISGVKRSVWNFRSKSCCREITYYRVSRLKFTISFYIYPSFLCVSLGKFCAQFVYLHNIASCSLLSYPVWISQMCREKWNRPLNRKWLLCNISYLPFYFNQKPFGNSQHTCG